MEEAGQGGAGPPGAPPGYVVTSPSGVKAKVNGDGGQEEEEEIVGYAWLMNDNRSLKEQLNPATDVHGLTDVI